MNRYLCITVMSMVALTVFSQKGMCACEPPTNLKINTVNCNSVDFTWTNSNTALHYEYCVDLHPTIPVGPFNVIAKFSANNVVWTGMAPNTLYYIHMRSLCNTETSAWVHIPVTTKPCPAPQNIIVVAGDTTVTFQWDSPGCAKGYEYSISTTPGTPTGTGTYTTLKNITQNGLVKGTKYYVYVRSICDSFFATVNSKWAAGYPADINSTITATQKIQVYPNPATDVVNIETEVQVLPNPRLQLFSPDGRLIATEEMTTKKKSINTSNLQSGLYFLWYDDGSRKQRFKILKL